MAVGRHGISRRGPGPFSPGYMSGIEGKEIVPVGLILAAGFPFIVDEDLARHLAFGPAIIRAFW